MYLIVAPICLLLFVIFPYSDEYVVRTKKLYIANKVIHSMLCVGAIILHICFWEDQNTNNVILGVFLLTDFVWLIMIHFISRQKVLNKLKQEIMYIENYKDLSLQQIRNILLQNQSEYFDIKEIEKAYKSLNKHC